MQRLFRLALVLSVLAFVSCVRPDEGGDVDAGGEGVVTLSLGLESALKSRAVSDGTGVDRLCYAIFSQSGELLIPTTVKDDAAGLSSEEGLQVSITLAKGRKYVAAFWAQSSLCEAYTLTDDMRVQIDYEGANNDESRDAFFAVTAPFEVGDEVSVKLKRPFAQINIGAYPYDWEYVRDFYGVTISMSEASILGVPNELNVVDGSVTGSVDVRYTIGEIPSEELSVDVDNNGVDEKYKYISMSYVLASEQESSHAVSFRFSDGKGSVSEPGFAIDTLAVKRNWRTNIVGQTLTSDGEYAVKFDSAYDVAPTNTYVTTDSVYYNVEEATTISNTVYTLTDNYGAGAQFASVSGQKITLNNVVITGETWVVELGEYRGVNYVTYENELNNVVVQDLKVSSNIICHEWHFSPAVIAYGKSTLNNCRMTGTTTVAEPKVYDNGEVYEYIPVDLGVRNESDAVINGGIYGTVFAWTHAVVDVYDAVIDTLYCGTCDSTSHSWMTIGAGTSIRQVICCEPRCPYGGTEYSTTMTIKAGANVGSLQLVSTDVEFLIIEEGARVGKITCEGVEYTYEELRAAMGL